MLRGVVIFFILFLLRFKKDFIRLLFKKLWVFMVFCLLLKECYCLWFKLFIFLIIFINVCCSFCRNRNCFCGSEVMIFMMLFMVLKMMVGIWLVLLFGSCMMRELCWNLFMNLFRWYLFIIFNCFFFLFVVVLLFFFIVKRLKLFFVFRYVLLFKILIVVI